MTSEMVEKTWEYSQEEREDFYSESLTVLVFSGRVEFHENWGYTDELYSDGVRSRMPIRIWQEVSDFINAALKGNNSE